METILVAQAGGSPGMAMLINFVLFLAIIYFLLILPQRRERKRHQEMVASLARGDQVVTFGGLIGEIVGLKEDQVMLKTGDTRVVVERGKIARRTGPVPPAAK